MERFQIPTLIELEAQLLRCKTETTNGKDVDGKWIWRDSNGEIVMWSTGNNVRTSFEPVSTVAEAHGVRFLCPKSFAKNGGPKGTHSVYIFFTGSPHAGRNLAGQEVRWQVAGGSTIADLSLTPSIQEQDDELPEAHRCNWHGFVGSNGVPPGSAA